jgi:hypothetical protein
MKAEVLALALPLISFASAALVRRTRIVKGRGESLPENSGGIRHKAPEVRSDVVSSRPTR